MASNYPPGITGKEPQITGDDPNPRTKPAARKTTKQRIKMRLITNPVKLDGEVIEYDPNGDSFVVRFDGPFPDTRFFPWRESAVTTVKITLGGNGPALIPGCQIWEVL